jgi:PIN domain
MVSEAPHKQLLIIDTNIALHQIDILEHKCPATGLVVVLQTVLQEVRHRNLAVFRRLEALLKDETRSYIFFPNEMAADTAVLRNASESPNDMNDRAIRTAALYYQEVFSTTTSTTDDNGEESKSKSKKRARPQSAKGEVLLLTNDVDNQVSCVSSAITYAVRGEETAEGDTNS